MNVFVETVRGSTTRSRYDEDTFVRKESFNIRHPYPYDYGFIIGTNKGGGDCIDCYVVTNERLTEGQTIACDPMGMLEMFEDGEVDHKVLALYGEADAGEVDQFVRAISRFIEAVFRDIPGVSVRLGRFLSRELAMSYIGERS